MKTLLIAATLTLSGLWLSPQAMAYDDNWYVDTETDQMMKNDLTYNHGMAPEEADETLREYQDLREFAK